MANLYDDQFKRRMSMHLMVCDPISADIISELHKYAETFKNERDEARALLTAVRKLAVEVKKDFEEYVVLTRRPRPEPSNQEVERGE